MIPFPYSRSMLTRRPVAGGGGGGSFLLDTYGTGCVGAWSVARKLKSGVTYPLKAYWNSGSNSADIGFDGSDELDTAALLSAVGSDTARVEVYDQSGNGRDLTKASFGTRPRIVNAGSLDTFSGFPAMTFGGSQNLEFANWASTVGLSGDPDFCIFAVYAKTNAGQGHLMGWGSTGGALECVGHYDDGGLAIIAYAGGQWKPITIPSNNTLYQLTIQKAAGPINTNTSVYRNGSSVTTAGGSGSNPAISSGNFPLRLGTWANSGSEVFTGYCMEMIIYSGTKSADRTAIESDIRGYYGL